jgi:hypothetical protein
VPSRRWPRSRASDLVLGLAAQVLDACRPEHDCAAGRCVRQAVSQHDQQVANADLFEGAASVEVG